MPKIELTIQRTDGHHKDRMTGLGIELEGLKEEDQINQLEILFRSCIMSLYKDKYELEITERE